MIKLENLIKEVYHTQGGVPLELRNASWPYNLFYLFAFDSTYYCTFLVSCICSSTSQQKTEHIHSNLAIPVFLKKRAYKKNEAVFNTHTQALDLAIFTLGPSFILLQRLPEICICSLSAKTLGLLHATDWQAREKPHRRQGLLL